MFPGIFFVAVWTDLCKQELTNQWGIRLLMSNKSIGLRIAFWSGTWSTDTMTFQVGLRQMGWGCNKKICKQRVPVQLKLHDFTVEPRQWTCSFCWWCFVDLFANVLKQTHYFTRWRQVWLHIQVEGLVNEAKANNKCWSQLTTSGRCSWNMPDGRSVRRKC